MKIIRKFMCMLFGHNIIFAPPVSPSFHDTICTKCGAAKSYQVGRMQ